MLIIKKYYIFTVIYFILNSISYSNQDNLILTAEDLKAGINLRADLLSSVSVDFEYQIYDIDVRQNIAELNNIEPKLKWSYETIRFKEKIKTTQKRWDIIKDTVSFVDTGAWNGQKRTGYTLDLRDQQEQQRPRGTITAEKGSFFHTPLWSTPLEIEVFDLRASLSDILDLVDWDITGPYRIGEYSAYKMESKSLINNIAKLEVWIDPVFNFAPVQMILTYNIGDDGYQNIVEYMSHVKLEQINDVWVVTDAVIKVDNPNLENNSNRISGVRRFYVTNYQVGVELTDDMFEIKFPDGTIVYDSIIDTGYIVGEGIYLQNESGGPEFVGFSDLEAFENKAAENISAQKESRNTPEEPVIREDVKRYPAPTDGIEEGKQKYRIPVVFILPIVILCILILGVFFITKRGSYAKEV